MTSMRFSFTPLAALVVCSLIAVPAHAGPVLIRDSRVQDLAATPVLGRGYSLSTNTFQSACLKDVVTTEPSYDFQYEFKELDTTSTSKSSTTVSANGSYSSFWIEATAKASSTVASEQGRTAHSMQVTLNVDTYYASVNEASTPLSDSAAALLTSEDVPGFFAACGPNYVRGIGRNAQFVSLFTYETRTAKRDASFEASLQVELKRFGSGSFGGSTNNTFNSEASEKNLTITSRGWGLGKDQEGVLISYDLETFKQAIKHAFTSTQNPLTGRVISVEVVPWVENTEFQNTLKLRAEDEVDGREVPLYEKKDILTFNGEFLTEAERAARLRLNMYYKAKVCRDLITTNYYQGGKLGDAGNKKLKNHRLLKAGITLAELDAALKEAEIQKLWKTYEDFLYKGKPNMTACITELLKEPKQAKPATPGVPGAPAGGESASRGTGRGLFLQRFSSLTSCADLQKIFPATLPETIEDHCMPETI